MPSIQSRKVLLSIVDVRKRVFAFWTASVFTLFPIVLFAYTSPENQHDRLKYLQQLSTPLQESGEKILQIYADHTPTSPLRLRSINSVSNRVAQQVELEATTFFDLVDATLEKIPDVVATDKISNCHKAVTDINNEMIAPLRKKIHDNDIVNRGMENKLPYDFYAAAMKIGATLLGEQCF